MTNKLQATFYWKSVYTFSIWNRVNGEGSTCNGGRYIASLHHRIIHITCFRRNAITVISFLNTYLVLYFMRFIFQQQKIHIRHGLCSCRCFSSNNYGISDNTVDCHFSILEIIIHSITTDYVMLNGNIFLSYRDLLGSCYRYVSNILQRYGQIMPILCYWIASHIQDDYQDT